MKVLMSLSGGLDSSTLLPLLLQQGHEVEAVMFSYGSKHNAYEKEAAWAIAENYGIVLHTIDLSSTMKHFRSDLLKTGGDIPEGHYNDESMARTVVPGRNMIFASILAGLAESQGFEMVAFGVHQGDHHIYPDCRPAFVTAMTHAIEHATDAKVSVLTPFLMRDKADIVKMGLELGVPYGLTRTCYKDQPIACGKCGSCTERLEAFAKNNATDPVQYE